MFGKYLRILRGATSTGLTRDANLPGHMQPKGYKLDLAARNSKMKHGHSSMLSIARQLDEEQCRKGANVRGASIRNVDPPMCSPIGTMNPYHSA